MSWTAGIDHSAAVVTVGEWNQYLGTSGSLNYLKNGVDAPIRGSKNSGSLETDAESINIIEGTNITATVAYNGSTKALDVTLAASGATVPTQSATYAVSPSSNTADDVEGSWEQVVASIGFAVLHIIITGQSVLIAKDAYLDIGTGSGGAETEKIKDLFWRDDETKVYSFPFSIAAGTRIAARSMKTGTSDSNQYTMPVRITFLG